MEVGLRRVGFCSLIGGGEVVGRLVARRVHQQDALVAVSLQQPEAALVIGGRLHRALWCPR